MSDVNVSGNLSVTKSGVIDKDLLVKGWLYAANVRDIYVGVFESSSQLPADAKEKSIAGVVTTVSGVEKIIAWYKGSNGWESTGAELSVDVDTSIQQQIDAINTALTGKAAKSEMSVFDGTGANADKKTIQLRSGLSATVLKSHQSLSGLIPKVREVNEMIPQFKEDGTLKSSGKKIADFAAANHNHEGVYAPASGSPNYAPASGSPNYAPASGSTVYATKAEVIQKLGLVGGEMVKCTYEQMQGGNVGMSYLYNDEATEKPILVVFKGVGYVYNPETTLVFDDGKNVVGFVFSDASSIPENAFSGKGTKEVHISSFVHQIGNNAFSSCTNLGLIQCECMTPPTIGQNTFASIDLNNVTMQVHGVAGSAYWSEYASLRESGLKLEDMKGNVINVTQQ